MVVNRTRFTDNSGIAIVFIQFGIIPIHLIRNIERTRFLFPELKIVLITDAQPNETLFNSVDINIVEVSPYIKELKLMQRFKDSKDIFWIYSILRLVILFEYHIKNSYSRILHLESDVLLFQDFPFDTLSKIESTCWGFYNETHDVASLLYLRDKTFSTKLLKEFWFELKRNPNHSDMTILSVFRKRFSSQITLFPTTESINSTLINLNSKISDKQKMDYAKNFNIFRGIFDHQIIGMWLDGVDPKIFYGVRTNLFDKTILNGESHIDPRDAQFEIQEMNTLTLLFKDIKVPLYALHLHSKRYEIFNYLDNSSIKNMIENANRKKKWYRIEGKILSRLILKNLRSRTFIAWVLNIPFLKKLRAF